MKPRRVLLGSVAFGAGLAKAYSLIVRGAFSLDVGVGRRIRPLGPIECQIAADPETVFDVIAAPYLGKTPRAMADKLRIVERGSDMVLAEHFTDVGRGMKAVTVETVRFDRPRTVTFWLVRGPVPHVSETFGLEPRDEGTSFVYHGEMGTDFWALGSWWAKKVASQWERAVNASIASIKAEAERQAGRAAKVAESPPNRKRRSPKA